MVISRKNYTLACILSLAALTGCGAPTDPSDPVDSNATASAGSKASIDSPQKVVFQFLSSLKAGDQQAATSMLTQEAQTEMERTEAAIQPPGSPSAEFNVTEVEYIGDDQGGAHVLSVWSDVDSSGTPTEHEIVWILRRQESAWGIAGFATRVFADQPPLILNFEDPLDLQRKRNAVDSEIARRSQVPDEPTVLQARQTPMPGPTSSEAPIRR